MSRDTGISAVDAIGFDQVAIRHVVEALRAGDLTKCRQPELLHVVKLLEWFAKADYTLDGTLGEFVLALADLRSGAMSQTPATTVAQALADRQGFGQEWREVVADSLSANRSPEGYRRVVDRLRKKYGLTQAEAIRRVADAAGLKEDSVKKSLQRYRRSLA
jgi:hypothetical protein